MITRLLALDERAAALDDQLEHVLERDLAADRDRDVARRLEAPKGLLGLLAATLAGLIQLALSIAIAAQSARITAASSSASVNSPSAFSVRYRLPQTCPRITIGTPRKLRITGCPAGNP